jgi:hypothetical protein
VAAATTIAVLLLTTILLVNLEVHMHISGRE